MGWLEVGECGPIPGNEEGRIEIEQRRPMPVNTLKDIRLGVPESIDTAHGISIAFESNRTFFLNA